MKIWVDNESMLVLEENKERICEIHYEANYIDRAKVQLNEQRIEISSDRSLPPSYTIYKDGQHIGNVRFNLFGRKSFIEVQLGTTNVSEFVLKRKGFLNANKKFVLSNSEGKILVLHLSDKGFKWVYDYDVEIISCLLPEEDLHELLIYCAYTANASMVRLSGAAIGAR